MVPLRNCGGAWSAVVRSYEVTFADKYGPWAVLAGASEGVGAAFAEAVAERGVNVVLLARRQTLLDEVATGIRSRTGVQTRTLAVDLAEPTATAAIVDITSDLEVGFFVYFAGSDPNFEPFLANPIETAETLVERNCVTPMRLCHHFAPAMVAKGSGGIVIFGSGAGVAGGPNMVAYSASKAFDMVFAEALWADCMARASTFSASFSVKPTRPNFVASNTAVEPLPVWTRYRREPARCRTSSPRRSTISRMVRRG
jgi:short-subunit dehydrogenase